jgi:hypothetical protein
MAIGREGYTPFRARVGRERNGKAGRLWGGLVTKRPYPEAARAASTAAIIQAWRFGDGAVMLS